MVGTLVPTIILLLHRACCIRSGLVPALYTKEKERLSLSFSLVPLTGIEPVRFLRRGILSPLCLPVPPQRRAVIVAHFCYNVKGRI